MRISTYSILPRIIKLDEHIFRDLAEFFIGIFPGLPFIHCYTPGIFEKKIDLNLCILFGKNIYRSIPERVTAIAP